jgi:hypothetical protein
MKPSQNKCSSTHDWFVTQIVKIIPKNDFETYEFEKPIMNDTGGYIGSPDLIITKKLSQGDEDKASRKQLIILEFKPDNFSLTEVARQLKVYERYKYQLSKSHSRIEIQTLLFFCTYKDNINEELKELADILGIHLIEIERKPKGLSKW